MKAQFEDVLSRQGANSFLAYAYSVPRFTFQWHYHPEYELTLILNGSGKRLVGDSYENFTAGDLVLVGPDLPHTWVSARESKQKSSAVVVQFSDAFIGTFLLHPECAALRKLLSRAAQGSFFPLRANTAIPAAIERLPKAKGVARITGLLHILNLLAGKTSVALASPYFQPARGRKSEVRINKVCQHVQRHSADALALSQVADLVHLSESAFCKFFKRTTGKTYSDYLNEVRIGHACRMLTETDDTVASVAARSGFESLTYFNRVFLTKKRVTPTAFRRLN